MKGLMDLLNCCKVNNSVKNIEVEPIKSPKKVKLTSNDTIQTHTVTEIQKNINANACTPTTVKRKFSRMNSDEKEAVLRKDKEKSSIYEKKESLVSFSNIKIKESPISEQIFDTEIISTHDLQLSGDIFWKKEIIIDRFGLKLNNRKSKTGITSFGSTQIFNEKGEPLNDFLLNFSCLDNPDIGKNETTFIIVFDNENDTFYFKVLSKTIKINHYIDYEYFLNDNSKQIFYIGKIFVKISVFDEGNSNLVSRNDHSSYLRDSSGFCMTSKAGTNDINVQGGTEENIIEPEKFISFKVQTEEGKDKWEEYKFSKKDVPITIGRKNSSINIKNNSISKNHCKILYDDRYQQFFIKDVGSTNGTYLVMEENSSVELMNKMTFKIHESIFTINELL